MKLSSIPFFLLLSSILLAGCTKRQSVEGIIVDNISKQPISNVSIIKDSKTAIIAHSDIVGHFEYIDDPGYDTVTIVFLKSGYKKVRLAFRGITKGEVISLEKGE